jgi:NitT/TauT family transport system permease protein
VRRNWTLGTLFAAPRRGNPAAYLPSRDLWVIFVGQLAVLALVLFTMRWLVDSGSVRRIYLAAPTEILAAFPRLISEERLFYHLFITLSEALIGVSLAFVLGVGTGTFMGLSLRGQRFLNPFVGGLMAVPKVTIIPLLTLYLGIGFTHKIAIVFLFGYFVFIFNTIAGIKQAQENHLKVVRAFGANRWQTIFKVILPSAIPSIMAAVRLEAGTALVAALFAEIVASKEGLGNLLTRAVNTYDTASVFALVVTITFFALFIIFFVNRLERRVLLKWKYA